MQVTYWLEHAWLDTNVEPGVALTVSISGSPAGTDGRIAAVRTGLETPPPAPSSCAA